MPLLPSHPCQDIGGFIFPKTPSFVSLPMPLCPQSDANVPSVFHTQAQLIFPKSVPAKVLFLEVKKTPFEVPVTLFLTSLPSW